LDRTATSLVCPSIKEGFGLVVLEAMASGIPAIASNIPPFTEYLGKDDVLWCDPHDAASIAAAMTHSLDVRRRAPLVERGTQVVGRHDWSTVARAHLACYAKLCEPVHA
jgi:glycosyltransferase involved in cell wall biosynthesis